MLKVGIVGTNFISDWFVGAARKTGGRMEPVAIYSRSAERAQEFSAKNGLPLAFDNFESMLQEVDMAYIASPTIAHFDQAITAIEAGCHVLIEKTMTSTVDESLAVFAAAESNGVIAMEATRSLHTPVYRIIKGALPRLGAIRYAHFEKQQYSSRYDRVRAGEILNAFNPNMGNSALIDIGVYCIEPAVDLLGTPAEAHSASLRLGNGFDAAGSLQFAYPTLVADIAYSKIANGVGPSAIVGEEGALEINDIAETSRVILRERGNTPEVLYASAPVTPADTMHFELEAFADQVDAGAIDPRWREVTVTSRRIMDGHLRATSGMGV